MNCKKFVFAVAFLILATPVFAAPTLSVVPGGIQGGNWVWDVSVTPDLVLAQTSTPLAVELGFRLTTAPLLSATNINPSEFDTPNPGKVIFGWETLDPTANNNPVGLQVNTSTGEIFAAIGTIDFATPGSKPFLRIIAQGPGNGGPLSSSIQWLGAYAVGKGRIAQLISSTSVANFDIFAGTSTQIPEPASSTMLAIGGIATMTGFAARRRRPARTTGAC